MTLDPHLQGVLKMMADSGAKPISESSVEEAREAYRMLTVGSLLPEQVVPVASVEDLQVPGAAGPLRARLYRPEGKGPWPTVVYFHGGGWVIGDLDTHDNMCRDICRGARAVVLSVDYRLAPEHPYPAGIDDALAAARWAAANLAELGGNKVMGLAGDSAGGNFAAVVAQQLSDAGQAPAAQLLLYPATDDASIPYASIEENAEGYFLEKASMEWFVGHYLADPSKVAGVDPRLAPLRAADLGRLPPTLVVTAGFDPLRDAGRAYAAALVAAGVKAELIEGEGMIHGFFDMGRWSPAAQDIIQRSVKRFGEMLRAG